MLSLLHGSVGGQAARALVASEEEHLEALQGALKRHRCRARILPVHPCLVTQPRLIHTYEEVGPGQLRQAWRASVWHHERECLRRLEGDLSGGADPSAQRAVALLCVSMVVAPRHAALRWAHRLQRRGLLGRVLGQASLGGGCPLDSGRAAFMVRQLPRLARLAAAGGADASALLAGVAAAILERKLVRTGELASPEVRQRPWALWRVTGAWSNMRGWPAGVLAAGVELLLARSGAAPPPAGSSHEEHHAQIEALQRWVARDPSRGAALPCPSVSPCLSSEAARALRRPQAARLPALAGPGAVRAAARAAQKQG
jgi:hypothetical protein